MLKEEFIKRYGEAAYRRELQRSRDYRVAHLEECRQASQDWRAAHREEVKRYNMDQYATHREEKRPAAQEYYAAHSEECRQRARDWYATHREEANQASQAWKAANPKKVLAYSQELSHKGSKRYEKHLEYRQTGLQGERNKIRRNHNRKYKHLSIPGVQIHHEWIPGTSMYRGVALVDTEKHRHGIINVILVLEGGITLFTEKEIAEQDVTEI